MNNHDLFYQISLLMFSPGFSLYRELCNASVLSSHSWIKTLNLIICRQVKEEIKEMDICYIKRNPLQQK